MSQQFEFNRVVGVLTKYLNYTLICKVSKVGSQKPRPSPAQTSPSLTVGTALYGSIPRNQIGKPFKDQIGGAIIDVGIEMWGNTNAD